MYRPWPLTDLQRRQPLFRLWNVSTTGLDSDNEYVQRRRRNEKGRQWRIDKKAQSSNNRIS